MVPLQAAQLPFQAGGLPVQVLRGLYLGLLTGIVPAVVAWGLGFTFRYTTGVTVPGFAVVVLGLGIAGVNGGLLALNDPAVLAAGPTVVVAVVVVLMLTLYAHAKGDALGGRLPRRVNLRRLADRTLSADVVEIVDARRQARVRVTGEVRDLGGYPALPAELRADLAGATYTFPADLPLAELEVRTAERLRREFDLADVQVGLDDRGRATVAAAPPIGAVSRRVADGERAVSVETLVPTGVVGGDRVRVATDGGAHEARVVAARSGDGEPATPADGSPAPAPTAGESPPGSELPAPVAPTTRGGEGRLTVAVPAGEAETLLSSTVERVLVRSRETSRQFELVALLRRAGLRFERVVVGVGGPLDGTTVGAAAVRSTHEVAVLAARTGGEWLLAPGEDVELAGGDELFAVGRPAALSAFEEAVGE
jgi:hypothetical protein